jgi:endo-1,4-beta-D-glucanase Y
MKTLITAALSLTLLAGCVSGGPPGTQTSGVPSCPFPTAADYTGSPTFASNITETERNDMMIELFKEILLNNLIVDSGGPQERENFRMVLQHSGHTDNNIRNITTSETQGYGMMMLAYMAGCEEKLNLSPGQWRNGSESLKDYYDAMLRTVLAFPSTHHTRNSLFAWMLVGTERGDKSYVGEGNSKTAHFTRIETGNSAADGDMDIIYSLLLADKQWGENTKFDGRSYKDIAVGMLADFWEYCVHAEYHTLLLGDWAYDTDHEILSKATRPSDFILSHLKAYAAADPDRDWQKVFDATLGVIKDIRDAENAAGRDNGLLPDFVVRGENRWEVPAGFVLENSYDNAFAYNSCRVPWRLGTYYLLHGDVPIGGSSLYEYIIESIDKFAKAYSGGTPGGLGPVYLDGEGFAWKEPATFAAPFALTAMAAESDQKWVNSFHEPWVEYRDIGGGIYRPFDSGLYDYADNYYGTYIKMLVSIAANGYWWAP